MNKIILVVLLLFVAQTTFAQSFFHSLHSPQTMKLQQHKLGLVLGTVDSSNLTINAFRPQASIVAYSEPGNILMAGVGGGYDHLKWVPATSSWTVVWSVNAMAFAGGSVAPSTPASVMSVGLLVGVDNNLVMAGPTYNFGTRQFGVGVSVGINFNNAQAK